MIYEFYGILHKNAKKFLNKNKKSKYRMVSIPSTKFDYYKSNILSEKKRMTTSIILMILVTH